MKLAAQDIAAGYGHRLVLERFNLAIETGEIVALVGPNGSGKSTVLRALGRLLKPRGGTVLLDGRGIARMGARELAREMALLPQGPALAEDLHVEDLVWMGRSPHQGLLGLPTDVDRAAVERAITETGIAPLRLRSVSGLSGGERQRVWIAMALAQEPRVLLLDEPTTFLDLNHQLEVLDLVRNLNQTRALTVVMVLHDLNQAARYATRIVVLREGAIFREGTPADVLTPATLREAFDIEARIFAGVEGLPFLVVPLGRVGLETALAP